MELADMNKISIQCLKDNIPFDVPVVHNGKEYFGTVSGRMNDYADVNLYDTDASQPFAVYQFSWQAILRAYYGTALHT